MDAIRSEVLRYKLDGIANEMQSSLIRSAFSTIVKEGRDASASLFTSGGEILAQALAHPIHLTTLAPMMSALLQKVPPADMRDGDLFISNDPYTAGGTHIPDVALIKPILYDNTMVGFAAAIAHHQDLGGMTVGSTPTNATEIFQEGIRIPICKLVNNGVTDYGLLDLIRLNVRLPEVFQGDLDAQVAACNVGERRIHEMAAEYGSEELTITFSDLLERAERLTRFAIEALPDGVYRSVDYMDNDGVDLSQPVRLEVAINVSGNRIMFDLTGSNSQVRGPFNAMPSGSLCAAGYTLRVLGGERIPNNGGCFRPIELVLPTESIVNPRSPAPVGCRTATVKRLTSVMLAALKEVVPDRVAADSGAELLTLLFGGTNINGHTYAINLPLTSGSGASCHGDGVDVIDTDATNVMNLPIESVEMNSPLRINSLRLIEDSGGPGRYRGGLGCEIDIEVLSDELTLTYRGEREINPAQGAAGGLPGGISSGEIRFGNGTVHKIPSKGVMTLRKGDRVVARTAGGGGYGVSTERAQVNILRDLIDGKVSVRVAEEVYGMERHS